MDVSNMLGNLTLDVILSSPTKRATILSAGAMVTMQDGKPKLNILVEIDGRQTTYVPNRTSMRNIVAMHGAETTKWIGKVIAFEKAIINGKDCVIAKPVPMPV